MTHRCVISVDAAGIEPVHPRSTTSSWKFEGQACASRDSFPDYRSANQAGGGRTPFADAESAVSGSHKPRPSKKKTTSGASWDGRSDRWLRSPQPAYPERLRTGGPR